MTTDGEGREKDDIEAEREYWDRKQEENLEMENPPVLIQKPETEYSCNKFACSNDCWDTFVKEASAIERNAWIEALKWCFFISECQVTQEHIEDKLRDLEEMGKIEFKKD